MLGAVLRRREAEGAFEVVAEVAFVVDADAGHHFLDGQRFGLEQAARGFQPQVLDVAGIRHAGLILEQMRNREADRRTVPATSASSQCRLAGSISITAWIRRSGATKGPKLPMLIMIVRFDSQFACNWLFIFSSGLQICV